MKKISLKNLNAFDIQKLSLDDMKKVGGGVQDNCYPEYFACKDGTCIPWVLVNDGIKHCRDGSDEFDA
ncbi:hypothetical protein ACTJJB_06990 [Chitinophaga sp. 22536]|uniref:hypothetical protein n=1 Tax=unclassified Chitinophaga TaxID=2619133 RepID=UPI003F84E65A